MPLQLPETGAVVMSMIRGSARRVFAVAVAVALTLGACAGDQAERDPKDAVVQGVRALGDLPGLALDLSLQSTVASLQAMSEGELSADDAQKILDSGLSVTTLQHEDPNEAAVAAVIRVAGEDALELRFLTGTVYVRADVPHVLTTFGQDPRTVSALLGEGEASGFGFLRPIVEGRWISIAGFDQLGPALGAPPAADTAEQRRAGQRIVDLLEREAQFEAVGSDDVGDHYLVRVPLRETVRGATDIVRDMGQPLPQQFLPDSETVPDESVELDLWVSEGRVTQVEVDFLQLARVAEEPVPDGVERFALRIGIDEFGGTIAAPPDAVPLDVGRLLQGFFQGLPTPTGN